MSTSSTFPCSGRRQCCIGSRTSDWLTRVLVGRRGSSLKSALAQISRCFSLWLPFFCFFWSLRLLWSFWPFWSFEFCSFGALILQRNLLLEINLPRVGWPLQGHLSTTPATTPVLLPTPGLPGCSFILLQVSKHKSYRVSLKKGNIADFCLISVLEVGFYFFTCVLESEFWARFI